MRKAIISKVSVVLAIVLSLAGMVAAVRAAGAQDANAPVPETLKTAKRVFIGNAGADGTSHVAFVQAGDVNQGYNTFYAAMKEWGRYQLVGTPGDADLVMEIRFEAPLTNCGTSPSYTPSMELAILDGKTHFQVWTISAPVDGAFRKNTWIKNVEKGAATLVTSLKTVADAGAASSGK